MVTNEEIDAKIKENLNTRSTHPLVCLVNLAALQIQLLTEMRGQSTELLEIQRQRLEMAIKGPDISSFADEYLEKAKSLFSSSTLYPLGDIGLSDVDTSPPCATIRLESGEEITGTFVGFVIQCICGRAECPICGVPGENPTANNIETEEKENDVNAITNS